MTSMSVEASGTSRATPSVPRGRRRDAQADSTILSVAESVLAERGFAGFTVEEVSSRSGVAKTTIYRRFPSRDDLIVGVLENINAELPTTYGGGTVRERILTLLRAVRGAPQTQRGQILLHAAAEGARAPEIAALVHDRVLRPRHDMLRTVLSEGIARGELREDVDLDVVVSCLVGPALHLGMWGRQLGTERVPTEVVADLILRGLTPATYS